MSGGGSLRAARAHVFVADLAAAAVVLAADDAHHLVRVLRLRDGEEVTAGDGAGSWRACRIRLRPGSDPVLEPVGPVELEPPPTPLVTLAVALPKGERGDWAVQKLTEVGVDVIVPLIARRSVVRWGAEREGRGMERLARVARAAAMQARRTRLPELRAPATVEEVIGAASASGAEAGGVGACVAEPGGAPADLRWPTVLIGPEGGWDPEELPDPGQLPRVGLGPTILRTETAAVVAASTLVMRRHFGHGE